MDDNIGVGKEHHVPGGGFHNPWPSFGPRKTFLETVKMVLFIGKRYGPFDVACLPIGAYSPRHFMSQVHCSPEDAVAIHIAVKARTSIGMHWGTFKLTDEAILEPPLRLEKELARLKLDPLSFMTMKHGETKLF